MMAAGMLFLLMAMGLLGLNWYEESMARHANEEILPKVCEQISYETVPDPYDPNMKEVIIDGYAYIGYLRIPALDLELPVMSSWDYTRLKIAPCRYYGSVKTDDLVIAAHNYDRHFGKIAQLQNGYAVYFTDMDGITYQYAVADYEILEASDIEDMISGAYDLTLFTCTYGGKNRVTLRCDRVEETKISE